MKMKSKKNLIAAVAVILALASSIGFSTAYFSDYEAALGEVALHLSGQTQIQEQTGDNQKSIKIVNTGGENDASVVVRVSVYGPSGMTVAPADENDTNWVQDGDYYYYKKVLAPNEATSELLASVSVTAETLTPDQLDMEIIVNHESAIAQYEYDAKNKVNKVVKPEGWDYIPTITAPVE